MFSHRLHFAAAWLGRWHRLYHPTGVIQETLLDTHCSLKHSAQKNYIISTTNKHQTRHTSRITDTLEKPLRHNNSHISVDAERGVLGYIHWFDVRKFWCWDGARHVRTWRWSSSTAAACWPDGAPSAPAAEQRHSD